MRRRRRACAASVRALAGVRVGRAVRPRPGGVRLGGAGRAVARRVARVCRGVCRGNAALGKGSSQPSSWESATCVETTERENVRPFPGRFFVVEIVLVFAFGRRRRRRRVPASISLPQLPLASHSRHGHGFGRGRGPVSCSRSRPHPWPAHLGVETEQFETAIFCLELQLGWFMRQPTLS